MHVTRNNDGTMSVTMTFNQMQIIRFALPQGVSEMSSNASFHKAMGNGVWKDKCRSAAEARRAHNALEKAAISWATGVAMKQSTVKKHTSCEQEDFHDYKRTACATRKNSKKRKVVMRKATRRATKKER